MSDPANQAQSVAPPPLLDTTSFRFRSLLSLCHERYGKTLPFQTMPDGTTIFRGDADTTGVSVFISVSPHPEYKLISALEENENAYEEIEGLYMTRLGDAGGITGTLYRISRDIDGLLPHLRVVVEVPSDVPRPIEIYTLGQVFRDELRAVLTKDSDEENRRLLHQILTGPTSVRVAEMATLNPADQPPDWRSHLDILIVASQLLQRISLGLDLSHILVPRNASAIEWTAMHLLETMRTLRASSHPGTVLKKYEGPDDFEPLQ